VHQHYCAGIAQGVLLNKEIVERAKQLSVRGDNPNGHNLRLHFIVIL